jgi:hypothetical protein
VNVSTAAICAAMVAIGLTAAALIVGRVQRWVIAPLTEPEPPPQPEPEDPPVDRSVIAFAAAVLLLAALLLWGACRTGRALKRSREHLEEHLDTRKEAP